MAADTFDILKKIINSLEGPPNWHFQLKDEDGAKRFVVTIFTKSYYNFEQDFGVSHFHPVPIATYNEKSWQRWVFDHCLRTMHHELGEALVFDGKRPFAPCHGPGFNPYDIHDNITPEEKRIMQDGSIRPIKEKVS